MSIFNRLFKIGQSEAHAVVDKIEDPIKMTEQGIRDLKKDFQKSMVSLAEVKGISIRVRKDSESKKKLAAEYERKAMLLLQKMQGGTLDPQEAERLATEALSTKEQQTNEAVRLAQEAERHEQLANNLGANINKLKSTISTYQNDLVTLIARARTAESTKKINKQLAQVDSSGTIVMLEKMKAKVEEDESLAQAYGEIVSADQSIDDEISAALESGQRQAASDSLLEMKKKMGIE